MKFLVGFVAGVLIVPLAIYIYIASGRMPVSTSAPPLPMERTIAKMALAASMGRDHLPASSIPADQSNVTAGATIYRQNCAVCHGLPSRPKTPIAAGMFPSPPDLVNGKGVTDDDVGETYWKAKNGIRLTGMPGFSKTLTETELWQVSQLLATADKLPASAQKVLAAPSP